MRMRVLVVEDERRLALALRHGLTAQGFTVDVAHDGPSGLARAMDHAYDVVVLDVMLPGLNGYRVCSRLRACGSDVGILMLTAKDGEWDEAEALDTGADDYLSKPFSFVVLVARLKALARRIGSRAPRRTVLGDLVIDSAARTCTRAGTAIPLTPPRVRHPRPPCPQGRRGRLQAGDPRRRLGQRPRQRPQHRRGPRQRPAAQDRHPLRASRGPDRPRRRLPAGGRRWLTGPPAGASAGAAHHRLRAAAHRHLARHPRAAVLVDRLTPRSVRARTTLAACVSVAVVLSVASAAVVFLLRVNLERTVEADTREQAQAVARLATDGRLTSPLPLDRGTDFIQVVDANGAVVAASQNLTGRPSLAPRSATPTATAPSTSGPGATHTTSASPASPPPHPPAP
ncbi:hypothetical protein GCM10020000_18000 [Streptomyces olivoverticillatus]